MMSIGMNDSMCPCTVVYSSERETGAQLTAVAAVSSLSLGTKLVLFLCRSSGPPQQKPHTRQRGALVHSFPQTPSPWDPCNIQFAEAMGLRSEDSLLPDQAVFGNLLRPETADLGVRRAKLQRCSLAIRS